MAYKVLLSESAEHDRDAIVDYLLYDLANRIAAQRFMDVLDEKIELLEQNPYLFALSKEPRLFRLGYRTCHLLRYLILYRVDGDVVYVARLFHQTQDYAQLV